MSVESSIWIDGTFKTVFLSEMKIGEEKKDVPAAADVLT